MDLPRQIKDALEQRLHGVSRRDLARRAAKQTQAYRTGETSQSVIATLEDALAYAVVRMPATYAACVAALTHTHARIADFQPRSVLDIGSGPGTASYAATSLWPSIERITMLEPNAELRALARELADASGMPALMAADIRRGDLTANAPNLPPADLVVAAYVLIEQRETIVPALARALLAGTRHALVLIEPGTPAGFARIRTARDTLIELEATPLAPCPHANPCPIAAPDWCHFSVRLARSRDHRLTKSADAPFEDEKFSYLAVAATGSSTLPPVARILSRPRSKKGETSLRLCTPTGIVERRFQRRDQAAFKTVSRLDWGDQLPDIHSPAVSKP
jgi:ribosomal protein RSM22 (predicted rRNA methylase)